MSQLNIDLDIKKLLLKINAFNYTDESNMQKIYINKELLRTCSLKLLLMMD